MAFSVCRSSSSFFGALIPSEGCRWNRQGPVECSGSRALLYRLAAALSTEEFFASIQFLFEQLRMGFNCGINRLSTNTHRPI